MTDQATAAAASASGTAAAQATTTQTAAGAAAATTQTAAFDWKTAGLEPDNLGYVENLQFKGPNDVVKSYRELQKITGDMNSIIRLPKEQTPEAMKDVWGKLGRPETAEGYKLPIPQGDDGAFAKTASTWFHEVGLTSKQAEALATKWNEHQTGVMTAQAEAQKAQHKAELTALQNEQGAAWPQFTLTVDRAAEAFGMSQETLAGLKATMGPAAAMKLLHTIGSKLGTDDKFVSGDTPNGNSFNALTPAAAKERIAALKRDAEWVKKYQSGGIEQRNEMDRLHRMAYPPAPQNT